jgi:hypothetical protein
MHYNSIKFLLLSPHDIGSGMQKFQLNSFDINPMAIKSKIIFQKRNVEIKWNISGGYKTKFAQLPVSIFQKLCIIIQYNSSYYHLMILVPACKRLNSIALVLTPWQ